jgi:hypothetical protein
MFETTIKQLVTITLDKPVTTEFYCGTLFVRTISEAQARTVFHTLSKQFGLGSVQVSPIGDTGEYAFDFIEPKTEELSPFATVNS